MPNKEKVIKGIERCLVCETSAIATTEGQKAYRECEYTLGMYCRRDKLLHDVLALLKDQEAMKPIYIENPYTHLLVSYCPKCREPIDKYITGNPYRKTEYCHYCGQKVNWDEID